MARRLSGSLFATAKQSVFSVLSRSNTTAKQSVFSVLSRSNTTALIHNSSFFLLRIRPIVAASSYYGRLSSTRGFATGQTENDPDPNWSDEEPTWSEEPNLSDQDSDWSDPDAVWSSEVLKKTTILPYDGSEHWVVYARPTKRYETREDIIDGYIKALAMVFGSEEEARMRIYFASTRLYFGARATEEVANKIEELPTILSVLPDVEFRVRKKLYGGPTIINGQVIPYDPLYESFLHKVWMSLYANEYERNWRNDRPQPCSNMVAQPNPPPNPLGASNMGAQQSYVPNNPGTYPLSGPPNNAPNYHYGPRLNNGGAPPYQPVPINLRQAWGFGLGQNSGNYANIAWPNWSGFGPNMGHGPGQNNAPNYHYGPGPGPNYWGAPPPYQPDPNNISQDWGFGSGHNSGHYATNAWPNWSGFGPNMVHGPGQSNTPNYHYGPGSNNREAPPPYQPGPNDLELCY